MVYAAKALGMTMADLLENPELVEQVKAEFLERKGKETYEPMIPEGPPPIDAD
jgi:aminobenzoyl-glutamate utilization protein B